ncbi:MAG: aspartate aminotransferase [Candidatus Neomarinimicrobiota bacterium]|nr:MAG: aspartate aminotransferase [Candidatus Neomarinimicrobiota bacterium]
MVSRKADELNGLIRKENPTVYELLSLRGRSLFFPRGGIIAQAEEAKGCKINATAGIALDEDGEPLVLESISRKIEIEKKDAFTYASSFGKRELREKWREFIYKKNPGLNVDISLPVVTGGLTHALFVAGCLFADESVIIPEPYWGNYNLIFENGFDVRIEKFKFFHDEAFNVIGLDEELSREGDRKVLVLNFPHNPTGYSLRVKEAERVAEVIEAHASKGKKFVIICDDAYFGLAFEPDVFTESLFSVLAGLHENILAVKVDGATKEDYVWGFRVGFITFGTKKNSRELYNALEEKAAGAVRGTVSNCSHLSQSLLIRAFEDRDYDNEKRKKYELLKRRYEQVKKVLKEFDNTHFEPLPFNSGYFMCLKVKGVDAEQVRQLLLKKYSTGVIATGDLIRVAFSSTPIDKIQEVFENIYKACDEIIRR